MLERTSEDHLVRLMNGQLEPFVSVLFSQVLSTLKEEDSTTCLGNILMLDYSYSNKSFFSHSVEFPVFNLWPLSLSYSWASLRETGSIFLAPAH